ncbi:MAG: hypothetical protein ACFFD1_05740 [Candidatus Thorarchaeota archaeon]
MANERIKMVLIYNPDRDDFFPVQSEELDTKNNTYLIIDEIEEKSTLTFPETTSLVQKRTIERRVSSYLKVGYPVDDKGLRIGANFPLEKLGAGVKLPDNLLTHGHTFGKARLQRDEIPDYVEKEDNYDVVPGVAATKPLSSGTHIESHETEVKLAPPPMAGRLAEKPSPSIEVSTEKTLYEGPKIVPSSSSKAGTDNEIFALGQFVDQFVRSGKIVMVYLDNEKYVIQTLKNVSTRLSYDPDTKYEVVGTDLFQK